VELNRASEAELETLPGIGPALAGRIVAWRHDHGEFARLEDLASVPGIGPALLERLAPLVTVSGRAVR
jgi:competence protein ComEA